MNNERQIMAASFADDIKKRLDVDTAEKLEVVNALGYGCTLHSPRMFNGYQMGPYEWKELARRIDRFILDAVAKGLAAYGSRAKNRCWYILGMLANEYKALESGRCRGGCNFKERRYTEADFANIMTRMEDLDPDDI